ncbi:hypothetical protein CC78DRAFT_546910 [Lojkania enalia]|uniref:Uncharacterized protein n=1 Tax=Lojkania enalia TaxID=147567 RepID=A0A9P4MXB6_9PLEO|nr:hypothetical protein CC78DRAFT_546910 [Didymosphaeria enalia]
MVNWGPDKDSILLVGIMEFANMTLNKELLEYLAKKIGEDCTPKAVQHRLTNMKAKSKAASGAKTPRRIPSKVTKSTPKATGKGRGRKKVDEDDPQDDDEDLLEFPTPTKRSCSTKKWSEEIKDEEPFGKKIKVEEQDGGVLLGVEAEEDDAENEFVVHASSLGLVGPLVFSWEPEVALSYSESIGLVIESIGSVYVLRLVVNEALRLEKSHMD